MDIIAKTQNALSEILDLLHSIRVWSFMQFWVFWWTWAYKDCYRTTVLMRPNLAWARWLLDCQWGQSHKDPEGIKQVLSTMLHERNVTSEVPCRSNVGKTLTTPLHTSMVRVPNRGSEKLFCIGFSIGGFGTYSWLLFVHSCTFNLISWKGYERTSNMRQMCIGMLGNKRNTQCQ